MCAIASSAKRAWSAITSNLQSEVLLDPFHEPVEGDVVGLEGSGLPVLLDGDRIGIAGLAHRHRRPAVLVDERAELGELRIVTPSGHQTPSDEIGRASCRARVCPYV